MSELNGIGSVIWSIFFIIIIIFMFRNYTTNKSYEMIFNECESLCLDISQEYFGVTNIKENPVCVCNSSEYPVYRIGLWNYTIIVHNQGEK